MASTTHGNYITHLDMSLNKTEEKELKSHGFKKIDVDLNEGAGGKQIYIWYKKESGVPPITRLQVTFNSDMIAGLREAGYTKIDKDLNAGARGDNIYLWYFSGCDKDYDTPIVDMDVTIDAVPDSQKFGSGWERLACDLNRKAGGNWIHAWVKRERQTYICDVAATQTSILDLDLFQDGYIRVDENTNRGAGGVFLFIWYRQTTDPKLALNDLQISTNDSQFHDLKSKNYKQVSVNLNEGTKGNEVYLWFKQDEFKKPIKAITVLVNSDAMKAYDDAGLNVIKRNLNTGNKGTTEYLSVHNQ
ncbi:uncharacterized protein LOC121882520 [Thunnus maccoyii]|uniref:uncharacterized protein LOC121882520 n=1 Tax=Thunnus maccoyii TaxID=8240 RepID=UPI001C4D2821|nr:uncharacterized protein LOC121882520 [Thunnus maccoyii]